MIERERELGAVLVGDRDRPSGLALPGDDDPSDAQKVCAFAFEEGLLAETAGPSDEVVKLLPPLTVTDDELEYGLNIIAEATAKVCA